MNGKKEVFWSLFSLLLAALSIWTVLSVSGSISPREMAEEIAEARKPWLFAAVFCAGLYVFLEGEALWCILRGIGYRRGVGSCLLYSTADVYFSAITPSATGGQPASALFMVRGGVPAGITTVTLLVNLIMYTLSIMTLGIVSLVADFPIFHAFRPLSKVLIGLGFLILSGLTCLFFLMLSRGETVFGLLEKLLKFLADRRIVGRYEARLEKLRRIHADFDECAKTMRGRSRTLWGAYFLNLAQRVSQIAVPVFAYLALGGEKSQSLRIFTTQCMSTIGYNCVPIPGAMGVADYLMVDGFADLIGRDEAFRLEMLSRGVSFYFCVAACGLITLAGYVFLRKRKEKNRNDRSL